MSRRPFSGSIAKVAVYPAALFALAIWAMPTAAQASTCPADETGLEISITDLRDAKGNVTITVYPDDKKRFLAKGGKLSRLRVTAQAPVTTACMPLPAAGIYAVAIYHDENANGKFDRNFIGLPEEGYGFSNNAKIGLAPPSFDAVKFQAGSGSPTRIAISMLY